MKRYGANFASFLDNQGFELLYSVYFCICSIHIIIFRR